MWYIKQTIQGGFFSSDIFQQTEQEKGFSAGQMLENPLALPSVEKKMDDITPIQSPTPPPEENEEKPQYGGTPSALGQALNITGDSTMNAIHLATVQVLSPQQAAVAKSPRGGINKNRIRSRAYRKSTHHTLLRFPIGRKGTHNEKCVSFGTVIDKIRHAKYHVVSITKYNSRYERCGKGIRLFVPQFEEILAYKGSISSGLQDVSHGAALIFKMQLGSGIRVSINLETGNLDFQHFRGVGKDRIATNICVSLDKDEWENLVEHEKMVLDKIQLHKNDPISAPYNDESNEHIHYTP